MHTRDGRKIALLVAFSLSMSLGIASSFAMAVANTMTKSVIVTGEKVAAQSFGECITKSDLIVLGEYMIEGKIRVKTVLKGGSSWVGKTITLPNPVFMGCRSQPVPSIKNAAVLLHSEKLLSNAKNDSSCVIEMYDTPDQISFLQCFIPVYAKASEHARLTALSELFVNPNACNAKSFEGDPSPTLKKEFLWAIKGMLEPANFEIVKKLYLNQHLDAKDKLSLQDWIANTRDNRAVPILLEALHSKDRFVVSDAVCKLVYYYPSESVDASLSRISNSAPEDTRPTIARYLQSRGIKLTGAANQLPPQTPFQNAEELGQGGKWKEAVAIYISILESKEANGYVIRAAALKALQHGDSAVRARILKSRIDWLNHDAATGNYLEAADTAEILRQLHDPGCLDGLKTILSRRDFIFSKANKIATMAIVELGLDARKKAAVALLKEIGGTGSLANNQDEQLRLLLEFAWIKQPADYETASKLIADKPGWSSAWKSMQPLLQGLTGSEEGSLLIQLLKQRQSLSPVALDWIVYRLGDLRESRAADALVELFRSVPSYSPQTISTALEAIGGAKIAGKMEAIAINPNSPYQASAVEILAGCQHEKALPVLRNVLKTGGLDAKVRSLAAISRFGNCEDWKALTPMADYWTGERDIHYWLLQAISEIGQRCHCK